MIENDGLTCSICLEEIFPVHKIIHTSCSHTYHDECFEQYVISLRDNNRTIRCPICRSDIINEPYATPPHSPASIFVTVSTNTRPQTVRYLRNDRQNKFTPCQKILLITGGVFLITITVTAALLMPIYFL